MNSAKAQKFRKYGFDWTSSAVLRTPGRREWAPLCNTVAMSQYSAESTPADAELDASGLNCPMPLLKAKQALNRMSAGELLRVIATDPGSVRDFEIFSSQSGNKLLAAAVESAPFVYLIRKRA